MTQRTRAYGTDFQPLHSCPQIVFPGVTVTPVRPEDLTPGVLLALQSGAAGRVTHPDSVPLWPIPGGQASGTSCHLWDQGRLSVPRSQRFGDPRLAEQQGRKALGWGRGVGIRQGDHSKLGQGHGAWTQAGCLGVSRPHGVRLGGRVASPQGRPMQL